MLQEERGDRGDLRGALMIRLVTDPVPYRHIIDDLRAGGTVADFHSALVDAVADPLSTSYWYLYMAGERNLTTRAKNSLRVVEHLPTLAPLDELSRHVNRRMVAPIAFDFDEARLLVLSPDSDVAHGPSNSDLQGVNGARERNPERTCIEVYNTAYAEKFRALRDRLGITNTDTLGLLLAASGRVGEVSNG